MNTRAMINRIPYTVGCRRVIRIINKWWVSRRSMVKAGSDVTTPHAEYVEYNSHRRGHQNGRIISWLSQVNARARNYHTEVIIRNNEQVGGR